VSALISPAARQAARSRSKRLAYVHMREMP
jgi:hypothetical protein